MKNGKSFFALTVSLAFLLVFAVPARSAERSIVPVPVKDKSGNKVLLYKESHALLIGVSAYTGGWPELRGVKEDVRSVKKVLENNGFHVVLAEDPTRERMEKAFNDFIIQYGQGENDRVLVYYAGHGHTLKLLGGEMGYIVPADAPNPNRDRKGFLAKAVDMQMMEVYAKRIQAKHALFLFDSCFSGSLFDVGRAIPENIGHKTSKPIRQFITAGSADETVPDQSVFREQFVAALEGDADTDKDGYVTGAELGEFLHKTVVNYSRNAQHPQYGKIRDPRLDKGDFVFPLRTASLTPDAGQADLLQERHKLEAERAQIEAERKKLTEEKQLAEERKKLEEEKRRLEEEKKRMEVASLPRG
ncbi:MAG: caspase family protein, partial [Nitrospinae bacterium]|nr:caspase family protein [Nitrospinota bacterium]